MRRKIEFFADNTNNSCFLLDFFFSSLPLPPAAMGALSEKTRCFPPLTRYLPQKLLIKVDRMLPLLVYDYIKYDHGGSYD